MGTRGLVQGYGVRGLWAQEGFGNKRALGTRGYGNRGLGNGGMGTRRYEQKGGMGIV